MLMSGLFGEDLFDDFWGYPTRELANIDKQLYGKHAQYLMKTDVHENEEDYEMDVDLPGFKKDQIQINLENGYLTISAAIRQERYEGSMQRSFYVGEGVKTEDVKAKFEDGVLKLCIPKKELKALPSNTTIAIEG